MYKNSSTGLTLFRQVRFSISNIISSRPTSNRAADSSKLFNLLRQYPCSDVRSRAVMEGTFLHDPYIHPQIQHAVRPLDHLRHMSDIYGANIVENFVHYVLPQREILYRTIAFVCAHVRTESMGHFYDTVAQCYQIYTKKSLKDMEDKHAKFSQLNEAQAIKCLLEYEINGKASDVVLDTLIESYRARQNHTEFSTHSKLSENRALITAYGDYLTKEQLAAEISLGMQIDNQTLFSQGVIQPISTVSSSERTTYMVCGAPATGKGELTKRLITQRGLKLEELCRIWPDEWHYLLKHVGDPTNLGPDPRYHGVLLREETLIIRKIIMDSLVDLINKGQPVPNCFMEVIIPTPERMAFTTLGGGSVKCYLTSHNDPTKVVEGSLTRYEKIGRLVWPSAVVQSFQDVSRESPTTIKWILNSTVGQAQIEVHDMTYLHEGASASSPTKPIYTADSTSGKMIIYDLENNLRSFAGKFIDPDAQNAEGLYLKSMDENLKEIITDFKEEYKDIIGNIVLVDPKVDLTKNQLSDEHVYAHFNDAGQLVIDNEALYDSVIKDSKISRVFLNEFNPYHSDLTPIM